MFRNISLFDLNILFTFYPFSLICFIEREREREGGREREREREGERERERERNGTI